MDDNKPSTSSEETKVPTVVIVLGMAGSGKTTLLQRMHSYLQQEQTPGYIINLDPAVRNLPYDPQIDIRDTVNYKNVMKQYSLGPNGGILTSLNLFATKFDQVLSLCEKKRSPQPEYIIVDTPGQIEIFTWSASGTIITDAFACAFPTVCVFVVDTPRCVHPQTFMSNMLQACSILYKTRLPLLLAFNKVDVTRHDFAKEWMEDFEVFNAALQSDSTYAATLSRSLSLVLEEFYCNMNSVGVSAVTGQGMGEFFEAVKRCAEEYEKFYKPDVEKRIQEKQRQEEARKAAQLEKLRKDLEEDRKGKVVLGLHRESEDVKQGADQH